MQKKEGKKGFFQDIQAYLQRSTSQTSDILTKLEELKYIERKNTRPQENYITKKGENALVQKFLDPIKNVLTNIYSEIPNLDNKDNSNIQDQDRLRNIAIQKTISLVRKQIDTDLEQISDYITKDQYDDIKHSVISSFEHVLSFVFQRFIIEFASPS
ncbi:MAG: hypothetical protein EU548_06890 [Promethearchaeota archaeon]|nr:MAG: hypothetical protein EU548_06890 [Candidatus Lokiarchaeota archaeon]